MRRLVLFLPIALALVAGAVQAQGSFDVVPGEACLVVNGRRLADFGEQLKTLDVARSWRSDPMALAVGDLYSGAYRVLFLYLTDVPAAELVAVLGQDLSVAVVWPEKRGDAPGVLLVSDLGARAADFDALWKRKIEPRLATLFPRRARKTVTLGARRVPMVHPEDAPPFGFFRTDRYLMAGNVAGLKAAFQALDDRKRSLSASPGLARGRFLLPKSGVFVWLSAEPLRRGRAERGDDEPPLRVHNLACAATVEKGLILERTLLMPLPETPDILNVLRELTNVKIGAQKSVPADFELFVSLGFNDGFELDRRLEKIVEVTGGPAKLNDHRANMRRIEKALGMDLQKDLFGALKGEVFVALKDTGVAKAIRAESGFSPNTCAYVGGVRCKAPDRLLDLVDTLATLNEQWSFASRDVAGTEMRTLGVPGIPIFSPSYAKVGEYVLFSPLEATLAGAIRELRAGKTVAASPAYRRLAAPDDRGFLALYVRLQPLLTQVWSAVQANVPREAAPIMPYLSRLTRDCSAAYVLMSSHKAGVLATTRSPFGLAAPVAVGAMLGLMEKAD